MAWVEPLDLWTIFVNYFAGSIEIALFLAIIFINAGCGYFKTGKVALLLNLIFFSIMVYYAGMGYLIFITLILGLMTFVIAARLFKL